MRRYLAVYCCYIKENQLLQNNHVINLFIPLQRCLRQDQGQEPPRGVLQVLDLRHVLEECRLLQYQQ